MSHHETTVHHKSKKPSITQYVMLVIGILAVIIGLSMLIEIAVGLLLLFVGFTLINMFIAR